MKTETGITDSQLQILRHSLGFDDNGRGIEYRNHFIHPPTPELTELECLRYLRNDGSNVSTGGMNCYRVTEDGKRFVYANAPSPVKFTRSQQRYRDYLDVADAFGGTFKEFLGYIQRNKTKA